MSSNGTQEVFLSEDSTFIMPMALATVFTFGCIAMLAYYYFMSSMIFTTDFFLTARGSQPWYRIAWGFFATSMGAGVIFDVSSFVTNGGGWVGLIWYAVFSGVPIVICAYMGTVIKKQYPNPLSIGSYTRWRFGRAFQAWVTFNVLLNLGVALCAEFTAIGSVYTTFLGQPAWIPILVVSLVTMTYTAAGGLFISLFTDMIQATFLFILLAIMAVYVSVNFRVTLPPGPLPVELGVTEEGVASCMTLGVALLSATMFSDSIWQRVWSAKNDKELMKGSYASCFLIITVAFIFGFGGFVAAWAGLVSDPNTSFLELLKVGTDSVSGEPIIPINMLLVVVLIASVMNEAAIDSFQIGITDTLISLFDSFGIKLDLWVIRTILALINVPFAILGCYGFPLNNLYLITNLMTTCVMIPFCLGLVPQLNYYVTGGTALFGSLFSLFSLVVYSVWSEVSSSGLPFAWADIPNGLVFTFYTNYDYQGFTVALVASVIGTLLYVGAEELVLRVKGKQREVPVHLQTSPYQFQKPVNNSIEHQSAGTLELDKDDMEEREDTSPDQRLESLPAVVAVTANES